MRKAKKNPERLSRVNPDFAAVVGARRNDAICEILRDAVGRAGLRRIDIYQDARPYALIRELKQHRRLGLRRTVVVLCSPSSDKFTDESLDESVRKIKECRPLAWIMVYAAPIEDSGFLALKCIEEGASDYVVRKSLDADSMRERLGLAMTDPNYCPYPPLTGLGNVRMPSVFIAMPYSSPGRGEYNHGIHPALSSLRIRHQKSDDEQLTKNLLEELKRQIDRHEVLIANLSSFGTPPSAPNANVYFELGYALGRSKKVLLLRRQDGADVASNLQGVMRLQHLNCADLALRVYFGFSKLRHYANNNTRTP
jgi:hypothetical protein